MSYQVGGAIPKQFRLKDMGGSVTGSPNEQKYRGCAIEQGRAKKLKNFQKRVDKPQNK